MQAIEQFVYIDYLTGLLFSSQLISLDMGATNGAMDAGNLLKLMLSRRELRCIGATTLDEYRKYIEKDRSLEHRFQQLYVDQPTVEDTVSILHGLHERYELHLLKRPLFTR
ncbi:putative P-loop containing nucleoside triphosphate hydrolase [Helianthus annuus]|uniref:P-loop containing nucleoside triphosphate hydrolase n=1 Tax=Helianthus annuus TaxID=4232 RepID=A0A9K3IH29_HELAN|nr:putative P-loop containing nucleoside triphosphate hydrolase [Helianthus annuus]KAJ0539895.1 putative P-loop containing nucleoside triphosphate hydrolase [Helianthus annuus]KAJ0548234.1 putative P-loop containing nucleoside triphosphate hydrolase [Helianthus annuus]KAJ0720192.1 putative P-loop containing nucleoside triphosphate hydrolase [Helianthus annuus]KAJ0723419.1 putative P-loop containing nucleoside triphosphate hydrolase [Helianthus annuus]